MNYAIPCSQRGLGLRFATLCVAAAVSLSVPAKQPSFDQIFSDRGEPSTLHYQAVFTSNGGEHHVEVWRDGEQRLKRRTDEAIETYVFRKPGDSDFRLSILDMKQRIHTRIDRTNLYRIGNFTDWFDLAHGLKHPMGVYRVVETQAQLGSPRAVKTCRWYELIQDEHTTEICWSAQSRLPMLIRTQDGKVVWRVTSLDQKPISAKTFDIHDEGFIRNDANQDIERD